MASLPLKHRLSLLLTVFCLLLFQTHSLAENGEVQFDFVADKENCHDGRQPSADLLLPDNKPDGQAVWFSFRLLPMGVCHLGAIAHLGKIKEGPRGLTETLEFERDLNLSPWLFGYTLETKAYFNRRLTIGFEYQNLQSASQGRQTHKKPVTRFNGLTIPQGDRTSSELSYQWLRGEVAFVFYSDWFYVELLFGSRFTATKLRVHGQNGDKVARQKSFNFFLPGAITAFRIYRRYWTQIELRNSWFSWPFGHQLTDARLSIDYLCGDFRIGIGGQFTSLFFFRAKKVFRQRRVKNNRSLELLTVGLFLDLQFSF